MTKSNVIALPQPGAFSDLLTEVLRNGARALLARAVEAETADFLEQYADLKTEDGRQRVARHGHLPERAVMTGIGAVNVRQPRVRDREPGAEGATIKFTPSILPPYARRSKRLEVLLQILYLKGISTGDFGEALVLALALFNGALEALIDHLHPELHPEIRVVKDMAAAGVLLAAVAAVLVGVALVISLF